ncbi:hypothetical protein [Magnetococcus sp. PR-3]|uniref:hypothetical protein n=1 Tax=Magnetococcus sp. PR-3 TaxID=3120355 RepID=UPI002FCE4249
MQIQSQTAYYAATQQTIGKNVPTGSSSTYAEQARATSSSQSTPQAPASTGTEPFQQALARIHQASISTTPQLLGGKDGQLGLGLLALGGEAQRADWAKQGLEVTEQTLLEAANTFNEGFQAMTEQGNPRDYSLSLNRHQLVMNTQDVPSWFLQEYQDTVQALQDPAQQQAFAQGEPYYISAHKQATQSALQAYQRH